MAHDEDYKNDQKPSRLTMDTFDPHGKWFVVVVACLIVIIFAGFALGTIDAPESLLEQIERQQEGRPVSPWAIFGLVLSFSGAAMLTVFTVVSLFFRTVRPIYLLLGIGPVFGFILMIPALLSGATAYAPLLFVFGWIGVPVVISLFFSHKKRER